MGIDYHRECGRHSGIPTCCVDWFVGPWSEVRIFGPFWKLYWDKNGDNVNYIRCLRCAEDNKAVELKDCDCDAR